MTDLIFLDTETTGLNPELNEVWEIATAVNDGPVIDYFLSHSLHSADMEALKMNGYFERFLPYDVLPMDAELRLRESLRGQTLVVANPTFDRMMLRERWRLEPWHYRSIDVENMAMTVFGWSRPRGMKDVHEELEREGFDVPKPNHQAKGDVESLRACYFAIRQIMEAYRTGTN